MLKEREYLGDAVYAGFDGYQIWLTASDLEGVNTIAIDPDVMKKLIEYNERIKKLQTKGEETK